MAYRYSVQAVSWMLALAAGLTLAGQPVAAQSEGVGEKIYQRTLRSTVWILAPKGARTSSGTGSLIDATRGIVITNSHVVGDVDKVIVLFPAYRKGSLVTERADYLAMVKTGGGIQGEVIHRDAKRDLALIKLKRVPQDAKGLPLAQKSPGPAQRVHSIGNPGRSGALWLYTSGTVRQVYHKRWSSKDRENKAYNFEAQVVETQSPTNPGDSGGPLVNDRGEMVAITQGTAMDAQLLSLFIDVSEIKQFLRENHLTPKYSRALARTDSGSSKDGTDGSGGAESNGSDEQRAANKLKFAKTLADDGKLEKAKDRYEEIITSFPNTKAAAEAKLLLDKLSK
jgi:S1-C subfamily serine protease